jgi:hypothetical protein
VPFRSRVERCLDASGAGTEQTRVSSFPVRGGKKTHKSSPAELDFGGHGNFGVTVVLRSFSGCGLPRIRQKRIRALSDKRGVRSYIHRGGVSKSTLARLWPRGSQGGSETMKQQARKGPGRVQSTGQPGSKQRQGQSKRPEGREGENTRTPRTADRFEA